MAAIPGFLLRHTASIEPLTGEGPYGPVFGPAVSVRCFADDKRRMVRDPTGNEIVSETTLYCPLSTTAPAGSKVTVNGRRAIVITASRRDGGGLPTPDHLELALT